MTAKIYCFVNQKGGVAKTTTAVNLGAYLAAAGRRVLLIDTDAQGNATTSLGIDPRELALSLYNVLIEKVPIQQALTLTDESIPPLGLVWQALVNWLGMLLGISILTTIYGHFIEKRDLNA